MKTISWNLNHRTCEKSIPTSIIKFFRDYQPDTIILNEYVDGESRASFKQDLYDMGYRYQLVSPYQKKHNQIFIVSRHSMVCGDLIPPNLDGHATTNFLHIVFPDSLIEIVGFRAPAYKSALLRNQYWDQVRLIMEKASDRPVCFIGDANYNPFLRASAGADDMKYDHVPSYCIPNPTGDWSYMSIDGTKTSRIDHAFLSSFLRGTDAAYISTFQDIVLAGSKDDLAITDHAVYSINLHTQY
ncbi:MAG: endonuclease/exonuclease/phosphatase family protein [Psychromonas sp.]